MEPLTINNQKVTIKENTKSWTVKIKKPDENLDGVVYEADASINLKKSDLPTLEDVKKFLKKNKFCELASNIKIENK